MALPIAGVWAIDPGHAEVGFVGRHFMLTKVRGRFTGVDGTVTIGSDPEGSRVSVVIDVTTLASGDEARDSGIRSAEHHVLAGALEVVIDDPERTRSVPATDRLRVGAVLLEVSEVRVHHRRPSGVQRDTATGPLDRVAV